ncbi:disulfide bond formation protein B [Salaquimonas pukyongi]|uniref:disulfide bond formation protein B n=1 Tax=Salaquimonas pukyongi TaxID=2712698 RepID=UPI001FCD7C06|nr:disulfide bond formation protein B [Salaquimonas pukyongi]
MKETGLNQQMVALLVLLGMVAVILTVLGFEHIGGYTPCKLCLGQREPYYAAIPVAVLALVAGFFKWPACVIRGLLAIAGILMVYAMLLGVQHAGIEWGWWEGTGDCGGGGTVSDAGNLLDSLGTVKPPSCDEAAGRFLGLSFAGWNVIVSLVLAVIAFKGAFGNAERSSGKA